MKKEILILAAIVLLVVVGGYFASSYYKNSVAKPEPAVEKDIAATLIREDSHSMGPADAKVTIVEFLDPECESCAAFSPTVKKILKEFDGKTRLVVRYAAFHKNAKLAAIYMEAAGEQGKYWEMMDKMFEKQAEWGEAHGDDASAQQDLPNGKFEKYAEEMGLNMEQFKASALDQKHGAKVDRDMKDVRTLEVKRTPTLYVNGRQLTKLNEADLRNMVSEEIAK